MLRFLFRVALKTAIYSAICYAFAAIGLLPMYPPIMLFAAAAILAGVNTLIRPVLVAIALPFNLLTMGIASIFANLLCLVIASAIAGGTLTAGFWAMLLLAFVIMLADDCVRGIRSAAHIKRAEAK